ncbi:MAG: NAD(P)-dependent oxidoreductase [Bacteroidota bacterium]|jgi:nucleoside-diphosphate-sugar epimerase
MKKVLITGGAGFFGELLKKELLNAGYICVSIDLEKDTYEHSNLKAIQGDIRNISLLDTICRETKFDAVYHCAAILAHAIKDKNFLWTSNVDGTRNVAEIAKKHSIPQVIFTSSNCLWAENFGRPVREDDAPRPVEIYGRSKWEGEKILEEYKDCFNAVIFRCPTIMDEGRLGLLAILFEFIDEGRKVWVVGGGDNVYQFIYAKDLIVACIKALDYKRTRILNIGSDNVKPFRDVYNYVIDKAQTGARVASLPRKLTIFGMELAHKLKISPLGPYQYKMIAEDFVFDTTRIKNELDWRPTLTNEEMLFKAYKYYHENIQDIKNRKDVSAHKQAAPMGIIRLLKWIS